MVPVCFLCVYMSWVSWVDNGGVDVVVLLTFVVMGGIIKVEDQSKMLVLNLNKYILSSKLG